MDTLEIVAASFHLFFDNEEDNIIYDSIINNFNKRLIHFQNIMSFNLTLSLCKEKHNRIQNYYEEIVGTYSEYDFYRLFRMTPNSFLKLLDILEPKYLNKMKQYHGGFYPIPIEKCLLVTLWYLGKGDTIISISDRFNITESKVHNLIEECIGYLVELANDFIQWPSDKEKEIIEREFSDKKNYPGVIGAIDGSHISCVVPSKHHSSYVNRKTTHSIVLQGTCNSRKMFTHIYAGFPGSAHDSRVLDNSSFSTSNLEDLFNNYKYHLLGDSAYPLKQWLITPYRDTGKLNASQRRHNYVHSATRAIIETAFGLLKGRWRILRFVNVYSIQKVVNITVACCVLHNFCLIINDDWDEIEEDNNNTNDITDDASQSDQAAINKRIQITEFLSTLL